MLDNLILYGAGTRCKTLCKIIKETPIQKVVIVDSSSNKWGSSIEGYTIKSPICMKDYPNANVCITIADKDKIEQVRKEIEKIQPGQLKKEISYHKLILELLKKNVIIKRKILEQKRKKEKEINIIFDCSNGLGLGGVETWTMNLCEAMIKAGKERVFIVSDIGEYQVPHSLTSYILYAGIDHKKYLSIESVKDVVDVLQEKLPCKVITCMPDEVMIAAYILKYYYPDMVEVISVIHNSGEHLYNEYMGFRECTDLYIAVSEDIREKMIKKGVSPDRIESMTCPFVCEKTLKRSYTEKGQEPIRIGYAGRMDGMEHSQKRMDLLLKLIKQLEQKEILFEMELAGDGPVKEKMEEEIKEYKLTKKVRFLGKLPHKEIPAFWKCQDICINLADYEGRSISIMEAMGNGAIPVVTNTSGVKEDIENGINGYIVSLGDYQAAAERIEYLSKNRHQLRQMGELAHQVMYPKSQMETHLKFWESILKYGG